MKMISLFPLWDMLAPRRVYFFTQDNCMHLIFPKKKTAANLDPNVLEDIQQTFASPNTILYQSVEKRGTESIQINFQNNGKMESKSNP